jgi:hypothetical protein
MNMSFTKKGQGESLIKLLVVAIIAIIAIALAKSYFRETSREAQKSIDEIFTPVSSGVIIFDFFSPISHPDILNTGYK